MTLETRPITLWERRGPIAYHARWVGLGVPIPVAMVIGEPGWWWLALLLLLALALLAAWIGWHGARHSWAGYDLRVPDEASHRAITIRVRDLYRVPHQAGLRRLLVEILEQWRPHLEDPAAALDGLTIEYQEDVQLDQGDGRTVDPRGKYDPETHTVYLERDLMSSKHNHRWEIGHPLTMEILEREGLPRRGEYEGWEREWRVWRDERGLL